MADVGVKMSEPLVKEVDCVQCNGWVCVVETRDVRVSVEDRLGDVAVPLS